MNLIPCSCFPISNISQLSVNIDQAFQNSVLYVYMLLKEEITSKHLLLYQIPGAGVPAREEQQ